MLIAVRAQPMDGFDGAGVEVVTDEDVKLPIDDIGVIIADEWGDIYHARSVAAHEFPDIPEIEEWTRFVAIQCPECEQPEGPWISL